MVQQKIHILENPKLWFNPFSSIILCYYKSLNLRKYENHIVNVHLMIFELTYPNFFNTKDVFGTTRKFIYCSVGKFHRKIFTSISMVTQLARSIVNIPIIKLYIFFKYIFVLSS